MVQQLSLQNIQPTQAGIMHFQLWVRFSGRDTFHGRNPFTRSSNTTSDANRNNEIMIVPARKPGTCSCWIITAFLGCTIYTNWTVSDSNRRLSWKYGKTWILDHQGLPLLLASNIVLMRCSAHAICTDHMRLIDWACFTTQAANNAGYKAASYDELLTGALLAPGYASHFVELHIEQGEETLIKTEFV